MGLVLADLLVIFESCIKITRVEKQSSSQAMPQLFIILIPDLVWHPMKSGLGVNGLSFSILVYQFSISGAGNLLPYCSSWNVYNGMSVKLEH